MSNYDLRQRTQPSDRQLYQPIGCDNRPTDWLIGRPGSRMWWFSFPSETLRVREAAQRRGPRSQGQQQCIGGLWTRSGRSRSFCQKAAYGVAGSRSAEVETVWGVEAAQTTERLSGRVEANWSGVAWRGVALWRRLREDKDWRLVVSSRTVKFYYCS